MVVPFVLPNAPWDYETLKDVAWVLGAAVAGTFAGLVSLIVLLVRSSYFSRPKLVTAGEPSAPADWPVPGELYVGQRGLAITKLGPHGRAQFGTNFVEVVAEHGSIKKGAAVEIVGAGPRITVRSADTT